MKKVIALLLCLVMVLSLCACGAKTEAPAAEAPAAEAPAAEAPAEVINYSYCVHSTSGWLDETFDLFAETLSELSGGRFVGKAYTGGTMGNEAELTDAVIMGDLTFSGPADTLVLQALGLNDWSPLPGLVDGYDGAFEDLLNTDGYLAQLLNEQYGAKGLVRLGGMDNGFRCLGTYEPIETVADLKGLKVREASSPLMVQFYENVGALPTVVDSSEVMTALEQGTVSGMTNSLVNLVNQGFLGVLPYVLEINYIYSARSFLCNADWYNALSAEDQALVDEAAKVACDWFNEQAMADYEAAASAAEWTVMQPSEELAAAFKASADKVWEKFAETCDPAVMKVLEDHRG